MANMTTRSNKESNYSATFAIEWLTQKADRGGEWLIPVMPWTIQGSSIYILAHYNREREECVCVCERSVRVCVCEREREADIAHNMAPRNRMQPSVMLEQSP